MSEAGSLQGAGNDFDLTDLALRAINNDNDDDRVL